MKIFTIGFTKTNAASFFGRLEDSRAKTLIDVRLNNVSQLAGFAKRDDLRYFVGRICSMAYVHRKELAPEQALLDRYKKAGGDWSAYEQGFNALIAQRRIETLPREIFDGGCLLCSEDQPHFCHRRLVAEYLRSKWSDVEIVHL